MTLLSAANLLATFTGRVPVAGWREAFEAIKEAERRQKECKHVYGTSGYYDVCESVKTIDAGETWYWCGPEADGPTMRAKIRFANCPKCGADLSEIKNEEASEA